MLSGSFDVEKSMSIYKNLMNSLIFEKEYRTSEQIEEKRNKVTETAKKLFTVLGDKEFEDKVYGYLYEISSVKPGRKLLKELVVNNNPILVAKGDRDLLSNTKTYMGVNFRTIVLDPQSLSNYFTVSDHKYSSYKWIVFAHELIHELHLNVNLEASKADFILADMDNLEEQHTISGFNHYQFIKKTPLKKIDILCENAFLIALKLPFRINHRGSLCGIPNYALKYPEIRSDLYYEWLKNQISSFKVMPATVYPRYDVMVGLLQIHGLKLFDHFPSLLNDKIFMLKALEDSTKTIQFDVIELVNREWLKDRDFIAKAFTASDSFFKKIDSRILNNKFEILYLLDCFNTNYLTASKFVCMLNPTLKFDEIIKDKLIELKGKYKETKLKEIANSDINFLSYLFIEDELLDDEEFILKILDLIGMNEYAEEIFFDKIYPNISNSPDVLKMMRTNFLKRVTTKHESCVGMHEILRKDKDLILEVQGIIKSDFRINDMFIKIIDPEFKSDPQIKLNYQNSLLRALEINPKEIFHIQYASLRNKEFILKVLPLLKGAYIGDDSALSYGKNKIHPSLWHDPEIAAILETDNL